jgi:putative flippase GtrA
MLRRLYLGLPEGQRQFLKFCLVGGIGFLVDSGTYWTLIRGLGVDPGYAGFLSIFVFGMTTTWLLNRSLTFRDRRGGRVWAEYLRFAAANGIGNSLNWGIRTVLVDAIPLFHRLPVLGVIAGTAIGLIFNFTSAKYFVFRKAVERPPTRAP